VTSRHDSDDHGEARGFPDRSCDWSSGSELDKTHPPPGQEAPRPEPPCDTSRTDKDTLALFAIAIGMDAASRGKPPGEEIADALGRAGAHKALAETTTLPATGPAYEPGTREVLEGWGFRFGEVVTGDKYMRHATVPPGWTRKATDSPTCTFLCDPDGKPRLMARRSVQPWDDWSHLDVLDRYEIRASDRAAPWADAWVIDHKHGDREVYCEERTFPPGEGRAWRIALYDLREAARKACRAWLRESGRLDGQPGEGARAWDREPGRKPPATP